MNLLTTQEAARFLRVSIGTLYRWKKLGVVTPIQLGHLMRWDVDKILRNARRSEFQTASPTEKRIKRQMMDQAENRGDHE